MRCRLVLAFLAAAAAGVALLPGGPEEVLAASSRIRVPQDAPTFQAAVDAAGPGFRIVLTPGTYSETVLISGKTGLTIDGRGSAIDGGGNANALVIEDSEGIELGRLVVQNASETGLLIRGDSSDITVSKCEFTAILETGVAIHPPATRVTIEKSDFHGLPGSAIRAYTGASGVRVVKNEIHEVNGMGIGLAYEGGKIGVPNSTIDGNRLENITSHAIVFGGNGTVVSKNRIDDVFGGWGIAVDDSAETTGALIEKNRMSNTAAGGIRLLGDGCTAAGNRVEGTGGVGILVDGAAHQVVKNFVAESFDAGMLLRGTGTEASDNKFHQSDDDGIRVEGTAHTLEGNQIRACEENGVVVAGTGHTLSRNKASRNDDWDLWDLSGLGANTYVKNKFPTVKFGP